MYSKHVKKPRLVIKTKEHPVIAFYRTPNVVTYAR